MTAKPNKEKRNFFELFTEIMGWLQIVISPVLICLILGGIIYLSNPNGTGLFLGITVLLAGLVVGILWANKEWKGKGTMWFMSRVSASPELDPKEKKDTDEKEQQ